MVGRGGGKHGQGFSEEIGRSAYRAPSSDARQQGALLQSLDGVLEVSRNKDRGVARLKLIDDTAAAARHYHTLASDFKSTQIQPRVTGLI
jgi:hypothetical protein